MPVGYQVDVSLTWVGERSGLEDLREGENEEKEVGEGELGEMGKGGGKCQEWIELEEGRLTESTKRWEIFLAVPDMHFTLLSVASFVVASLFIALIIL